MKKYINQFQQKETPFYFYDMDLLEQTIISVKKEAEKYNFHVHYALKANSNLPILKKISHHGFGADCVSGNEIKRAIKTGFSNKKIAFAGVGKTDKEINIALENDIFSFNVESIPELLIINALAEKSNKIAKIAFRLNPKVDAKTHKYITTGTEENKFGIALEDIEEVIQISRKLGNIKITGIHFHIGSQIQDMGVYLHLCKKINEIQKTFEKFKIALEHINVGGGLGINYANPEECLIADFKTYFNIFAEHLNHKNLEIHFELGRSIVAQCGSLISKVIYVKDGLKKKFVILDAGMTELLRPALYQAKHKIQNISSDKPIELYDVVGPICESADTFAKNIELKGTKRNDFVIIRSAGAYGEVMANRYNLRELPKAFYSEAKDN